MTPIIDAYTNVPGVLIGATVGYLAWLFLAPFWFSRR